MAGWLPLLPVMSLLDGATAGSLDGWGWRVPVPWFVGLANLLSKVEEIGF